MTDKERLEEINGLLDEFHNAKSDSQKLKIVNKVIWEHTIELIGQVAYLEQRVEELEEENEQLEDDLNVMQNYYVHDLKVQNERYKRALEFYADEEHYKEKLISEAQYDADGICISNDEYAPPIIYFDSGEKARQALEGDDD